MRTDTILIYKLLARHKWSCQTCLHGDTLYIGHDKQAQTLCTLMSNQTLNNIGPTHDWQPRQRPGRQAELVWDLCAMQS
eukprot:1159728-Pelagomonas_calceolata.AAC.4